MTAGRQLPASALPGGGERQNEGPAAATRPPSRAVPSHYDSEAAAGLAGAPTRRARGKVTSTLGKRYRLCGGTMEVRYHNAIVGPHRLIRDEGRGEETRG